MIFRPSLSLHTALLALASAVALTACSAAKPAQPPMERALAALEQGDGFGAELALRELLDNGTPPDALAAFLGQAELQQGQPIEARKWLGDGRFTEDTAGHGFHMLGRLEMREGLLPAAGQAFDRAIRFTPENPRLWVDIGRLRYLGGEQTSAVQAAIKAVELGPEEPEALVFRGQLARDAEGMHEALPWFQQAIDEKGDDLDLLAEYAATLGEAGETGKLLAAVRQMTATDPGNPRAYYLQAVVAARAGRFGLARRLLLRSGDQATNSPAGMLLSGVIDLETGNYASAAQELDRLYRQQPENRRVRDLLARSLAMGGSHRELVHRFAGMARLKSASPYLQTLVARSHEALGERSDAAALLDLAGQRRSGNLVAMRPLKAVAGNVTRDAMSGPDVLALVRAQITSGSPGGAVGAANGFLSRFPGSADALALAGDAQLSAGNVGKAVSYYQQSARIRQSWPLMRRRLAALSAMGRSNEALTLLQGFLAGHQNLVEPSLLLARAQFDSGNLAQAAVLLDHALNLGGDGDPEILSLRAVVALGMGEPQLARSLAQRAFELQPIHPASLRALAAVSDPVLAKALLTKAERLDRGAGRVRR
jgi:tetratricopeptide (TPR) repeat protein